MTAAVPTFATMTFSEMRGLAAAEPRGWLIDRVPLLPRSGVVLLVGDPLAGKSSFCASLATAMVAGYGIGPGKVESGRTLWLSGEHTRSAVTSKFERAAAGLRLGVGELDGEVIFSNQPDWTLDSSAAVASLAKHLDAVGVDLVVLDSFRRFSKADENSSQAVADALKQARALAADSATGVTKRLVIVIHHLGRNGLPRGSTDFKAVVDSVVLVERKARGWRLRAEHHTAAPYSCDAVVTETDQELCVDSIERASGSTTDDELEGAIKRALTKRGALGMGELRKEVRACGGKAKSDAIDAHVRKLVADGTIVTHDGERGRRVHTLAAAARTVQHNGAVHGGPSCPS